ncbi:MAG: hypothetical protein PHW63_09325 [Alphaproteobacteria bacterium]|nr:hypothetical protein [Alphaproteobacteria bacterium]
MESVAQNNFNDGTNSAAPSKNALPRENSSGTADLIHHPEKKKVLLVQTPDGIYHPCKPGNEIRVRYNDGGYLEIEVLDRGVVEQVGTTPRECRISAGAQ